MLLDVLSELDEIKICTGYLLDGNEVKNIPARYQDYNKCEPIYITLPGWKEDISKVKAFDKLPINAQNYIKKIEELVGVEVCYFSVGPNRGQTIIRKEKF